MLLQGVTTSDPYEIWALSTISAVLMASEYWLKKEYQDALEKPFKGCLNGVKSQIQKGFSKEKRALCTEALLVLISLCIILEFEYVIGFINWTLGPIISLPIRWCLCGGILLSTLWLSYILVHRFIPCLMALTILFIIQFFLKCPKGIIGGLGFLLLLYVACLNHPIQNLRGY